MSWPRPMRLVGCLPRWRVRTAGSSSSADAEAAPEEARAAEAQALLEEAVSGRAETLGASHADTVASKRALGRLLLQRGFLEQAADKLRDAAVTLQQTDGAADPQTLLSYGEYADALREQGDVAKLGGAKATLRAQLAIAQRELGSGDATTLMLEAKYAQTLIAEVLPTASQSWLPRWVRWRASWVTIIRRHYAALEALSYT